MIPLRGQSYTLREIIAQLELDNEPKLRIKTELGWGTIQFSGLDWHAVFKKAPKLSISRWQFMGVTNWEPTFQAMNSQQLASFVIAEIWPGKPEPWVTLKDFPLQRS